MLDLKRASCEDSAALIEERIDLLAKGTEAFAAERMNQGILQALRGQHIESLK
jgi:molecular chaperone HscA